MNIENLYTERENLRKQIRMFWKDGRTWGTAENAVNGRLNVVHSEIIAAERLDKSKLQERVIFSVCGWSEKHGYFRSKRFQAWTLEEAQAELNKCKSEKDWNIPTILVKETYFRHCSPAMVDFESGNVSEYGFSDVQEIIQKHMCGNKQYRWKDLIKDTDERFTY